MKQAVKRNGSRFPADFMFQLNAAEAASSRSQIVILEKGRGQHAKYLPYAFTEQGVAMLSSVLRSPRAIQVNVEVMRAFVRLRQLISASSELARKVAALELRYDSNFKIVFEAINQLLDPPEKPRRPIGFSTEPGQDPHSLGSRIVTLKNRPRTTPRRLSR